MNIPVLDQAIGQARVIASALPLAKSKGRDPSGREFCFVRAQDYLKAARTVLAQAGLVLRARDGEITEYGLTRLYRLTHLACGDHDEWSTTTPMDQSAPPDLAAAWARTHSMTAVLRDLLWFDDGEETPDPSERTRPTQAEVQEQARLSKQGNLPDRNERPEPAERVTFVCKDRPHWMEHERAVEETVAAHDAPIEEALGLAPGDGLPVTTLSVEVSAEHQAVLDANPRVAGLTGDEVVNLAALAAGSPLLAAAGTQAGPSSSAPAQMPPCVDGDGPSTVEPPVTDCDERPVHYWNHDGDWKTGCGLCVTDVRANRLTNVDEDVTCVDCAMQATKAARKADCPPVEPATLEERIDAALAGADRDLKPANVLPASWEPGTAWRRCPIKKLKESIYERHCAVCKQFLKARDECYVGLPESAQGYVVKRRSGKAVGTAHVACVAGLAAKEVTS